MRFIPANFALPLLAKELIEQAARKRTYVIRVLYATLLFVTAYLVFYDTLRVGRVSPLAVLGRGREMFSTLVGLQFAGIYFFMPAMTCSVITEEKERASLQLLFLTRLGPWTILFEKLFSRLIPMLYFLMLSLPLLAVPYTLGGLSLEYFCAGVWMLVLATVQTGMLSLACSAFFRTTVGAFIWSYLLMVVMFFGPGVGWLVFWSITGISVDRAALAIGADPAIISMSLMLPLFGPGIFFGPASAVNLSLWPMVAHSSLVLLACAAFLIVARLCIVRRAFLTPRNVMLNVFKSLDRIFLRLNDNSVTRGFVLVGDTASLPADEPVAWRETAKRSLGKAQYLLRVFIAIEIPVAVLCLMIAFAALDAEPLIPLLILVWIVALLMVAAQSASLIAGERSNQTLEVLCATPMTGREIIRQKMRSVWRLIFVLLVPFYTIFLFECSMKWRMPDRYAQFYPNYRGFSLSLYLVCATLSVAIYLPLCAWLSLLIGLKVRTQARAIAGSMAAILGWCVVPMVFLAMPLSILFRGPSPQDPLFVQYVELTSPAAIIGGNEQSFRTYLNGAPWVVVIVNFIWYGLVLVVIRGLCLKYVDRLLGRSEDMSLGADFDNLMNSRTSAIPDGSAAHGEE